MQIGRVKGATRTLGKSQGYLGLPVRDETINCAVSGDGTPCMITAWYPTMDELQAMISGAPVHLRILGTDHPPVIIETGPVPE